MEDFLYCRQTADLNNTEVSKKVWRHTTVRFSNDGEGMPAQQSNRNQRRKHEKLIMLVVILALFTIGVCQDVPGVHKIARYCDNIRKSLDQAGFKIYRQSGSGQGHCNLSGPVARDTTSYSWSLTKSLPRSGCRESDCRAPTAWKKMPRRWTPIWTKASRRIWTLRWSKQDARRREIQVKSGVVTLTEKWTRRISAIKPIGGDKCANVNQVVNDLQVKNQKATLRDKDCGVDPTRRVAYRDFISIAGWCEMRSQQGKSNKKENTMLWQYVILIILWHSVGDWLYVSNFIHVLLVIAIIVIIFGFISGRRPDSA